MKDSEVDRLHEVDAALRLLGNAEPRPGLERRVQARLALAASERRAWWRLGQWEFGGAVIAVCAVFAALALHWGGSTRHSTLPPPLQSAAPIAAPVRSGLSTAAAREMPIPGAPCIPLAAPIVSIKPVRAAQLSRAMRTGPAAWPCRRHLCPFTSGLAVEHQLLLDRFHHQQRDR